MLGIESVQAHRPGGPGERSRDERRDEQQGTRVARMRMLGMSFFVSILASRPSGVRGNGGSCDKNVQTAGLLIT